MNYIDIEDKLNLLIKHLDKDTKLELFNIINCVLDNSNFTDTILNESDSIFKLRQNIRKCVDILEINADINKLFLQIYELIFNKYINTNYNIVTYHDTQTNITYYFNLNNIINRFKEHNYLNPYNNNKFNNFFINKIYNYINYDFYNYMLHLTKMLYRVPGM
jgi:hypothetical protein